MQSRLGEPGGSITEGVETEGVTLLGLLKKRRSLDFLGTGEKGSKQDESKPGEWFLAKVPKEGSPQKQLLSEESKKKTSWSAESSGKCRGSTHVTRTNDPEICRGSRMLQPSQAKSNRLPPTHLINHCKTIYKMNL